MHNRCCTCGWTGVANSVRHAMFSQLYDDLCIAPPTEGLGDSSRPTADDAPPPVAPSELDWGGILQRLVNAYLHSLHCIITTTVPM
eukprot:6959811-Pyramimonas_sp.AAC.1